jgi:hypothetical protein
MWIEATAQRFGMSIEQVCSEKGDVSLKRLAIYAACMPARPFLRKQPAALEKGDSVILQLRRSAAAPQGSGNGKAA